MLTHDAAIHVQFADEPAGAASRGVPATLVATHGPVFHLTLPAGVVPSPGVAAQVWFGVEGKCYRSAAVVVDGSRADGGETVAQLMLMGEPQAVEGRRVYRVPISASSPTASVGPYGNCPVCDVSAEGFGALVPVLMKVGETLAVSLSYLAEGDAKPRSAAGKAVVRGSRPFGAKRHACGLEVPAWEPALRRYLQQLSTSLQRHRLRRLAQR